MNYRQIERRQATMKKLDELGIDYLNSLPLVESSSDVTLKDIDTICKKAIATLICTQHATGIYRGEDFEENKKVFTGVLERYGCKEYLNDLEKVIFEQGYTEQNIIDVQWEYEIYWALCW